MNILITPAVFDLDPPLFERLFRADREDLFHWKTKDGENLSLRFVTDEDLDTLEETIARAKGRGTGKTAAIRNIKTFRTLRQGDADSVKAKSVEMFTALLTEYLRTAPGHRIYGQDETDATLAYYVNAVTYHPPEDRRNGPPSPPMCTMHLLFETYGTIHRKTVTFNAAGCMHMTAREALERNGFFIETEDLRSEYVNDVTRYRDMAERVGLRVRAKGTANPDLDGNPIPESHKDEFGHRSRWTWEATVFDLDNEGEGTRGVVDIYSESGKGHRRVRGDDDVTLRVSFWIRATHRADPEEEDDDEIALSEDELAEAMDVEIPIHPWIPFFDLQRHLRMSVHVRNMWIDAYDTSLGDKLVLPPTDRRLIDVLVGNDTTFEDVVAGKSGGSIILTSGPPGVGKTLTAEVYSEVVERPLFSVQCSQLGIDAGSLEDSLRHIFARANRWNALLLLDEADVYIAKRGSDLNQNAIVGVLLRTLEYFPGTIFLTTNRGDNIDDAIASRCIARIEYAIPTRALQAKIWRILADGAGAQIDDETIDRITDAWPGLTGRDVKNLLKLSMMVVGDEPITFETVEMVKPFKPTADVSKGPRTR